MRICFPRLKMRLKQRSQLAILCGALIISSFFVPGRAQAAQVNLTGGYYSLTAKNQKTSGSSSNLGVYSISYQRELVSHFAMQLGYSIFMSEIFKGDTGFGPDLSLHYYPVTETETKSSKSERLALTSSEMFRPYVGVGFHQRQFQSVSAAYVGFGLEAGAAFFIDSRYDFRMSVRSLFLKGPSQSEAQQTDLLLGVGIGF